MTRISAIITTYNVEPFIATAMQSVIDAGFEDLELIVVDDGSRDATRQIADAVGAAAPAERVRYVPVYFSRNTIGGVACAANAGLGQASGDVVVFVDGDDWVLPHNLTGAVQKLLGSRADFTVCGCKEYWNDTGAYTFYPEAHLWGQVGDATDWKNGVSCCCRWPPFPGARFTGAAFWNVTASAFRWGITSSKTIRSIGRPRCGRSTSIFMPR